MLPPHRALLAYPRGLGLPELRKAFGDGWLWRGEAGAAGEIELEEGLPGRDGQLPVPAVVEEPRRA